jgi:hypothetical protein
MKSDFKIYYNGDVDNECIVSVSASSGKRIPAKPDFAKERIAFLDEEIRKIDECINKVESDIEVRKNESIKRGIVSVLNEEIKETRREMRNLGSISEDDYKNAKAVVRSGVFGTGVVGVIGLMISDFGALPLYMVTGLLGGGVLGLLANDSNAILKGFKKLYFNYKQFIFRTIRGICMKKREKRFYTLPSYYKLKDEIEELRYNREELVKECDLMKSDLELYYSGRGNVNGCHNAYHFEGYRMDSAKGRNNNYNGKIRIR